MFRIKRRIFKSIIIVLSVLSLNTIYAENKEMSGADFCKINTTENVSVDSLNVGSYLCKQDITMNSVLSLFPNSQIELAEKAGLKTLLGNYGDFADNLNEIKVHNTKTKMIFDVYYTIVYTLLFVATLIVSFYTLLPFMRNKELDINDDVIKPFSSLLSVFFLSSGFMIFIMTIIIANFNSLTSSITFDSKKMNGELSEDEIDIDTSSNEYKNAVLIGFKEVRNTQQYFIQEKPLNKIPVFGFDISNPSTEQAQDFKEALKHSVKVDIENTNKIKISTIFKMPTSACISFADDHKDYDIDEFQPEIFSSSCIGLPNFNAIESVLSDNSFFQDLFNGNGIDAITISSDIAKSLEGSSENALNIIKKDYVSLLNQLVSISNKVIDTDNSYKNNAEYKKLINEYTAKLGKAFINPENKAINDENRQPIIALQAAKIRDVILGFYEFNIKENEYEEEKQSGLGLILRSKIADDYVKYSNDIACSNIQFHQKNAYEFRKQDADLFNLNFNNKYDENKDLFGRFKDQCFYYDKDSQKLTALGNPANTKNSVKKKLAIENSFDMLQDFAEQVALKIYNENNKVDTKNYAKYADNKKYGSISAFLNMKDNIEAEIKAQNIAKAFSSFAKTYEYTDLKRDIQTNFVKQKVINDYKDYVVITENINSLLKSNNDTNTVKSKDDVINSNNASWAINKVLGWYTVECTNTRNGYCNDNIIVLANNYTSQLMPAIIKTYGLKIAIDLLNAGVETVNDSSVSKVGAGYSKIIILAILALASVAQIVVNLFAFLATIALVAVLSSVLISVYYAYKMFEPMILSVLYNFVNSIFIPVLISMNYTIGENKYFELTKKLWLIQITSTLKVATLLLLIFSVSKEIIYVLDFLITNITMSNLSNGIIQQILSAILVFTLDLLKLFITFKIINNIYDSVCRLIDKYTNTENIQMFTMLDAAIAIAATKQTASFITDNTEKGIDKGTSKIKELASKKQKVDTKKSQNESELETKTEKREETSINKNENDVLEKAKDKTDKDVSTFDRTKSIENKTSKEVKKEDKKD